MNRLAMAAALGVLTATLGTSVHAEEPSAADDIRAGRALSLKLCTFCHVVSPDQEMAPILQRPARDFHAIANKPGMTAESLRRFLSETHRSIGNPQGMPNPELTEDQVRQAAAFIMSLRDRR
jgi:mono/diheme cytochrome c family protein